MATHLRKVTKVPVVCLCPVHKGTLRYLDLHSRCLHLAISRMMEYL